VAPAGSLHHPALETHRLSPATFWRYLLAPWLQWYFVLQIYLFQKWSCLSIR
jgi:hypothetical protein